MDAKTYVIDKVKVQKLMLDKWETAEQRRLVDESEVSEQTLIRIFKGHGFSPESLYSICRALGCTPNDILTVGPKETMKGSSRSSDKVDGTLTDKKRS